MLIVHLYRDFQMYLPDIEFGDVQFACCINELNANQNEFNKLNLFDILAITCDDVPSDNGGMVIDESPIFQPIQIERERKREKG